MSALGWLAVASPAVHLVRFADLRDAADRVPPRRALDPTAPAQIGRAVERAARAVPGARCLAQGLVAELMLRRRGHAPILHVGVRKDGDALAAHAWVVCDGRVVCGEAGHDGFTPLWASAG